MKRTKIILIVENPKNNKEILNIEEILCIIWILKDVRRRAFQTDPALSFVERCFK